MRSQHEKFVKLEKELEMYKKNLATKVDEYDSLK